MVEEIQLAFEKKTKKGKSNGRAPRINWEKVEVDEVIGYYSFVFGIDMQLVLGMSIQEAEEMASLKVAIEAWKHSE